MAGHVVARVGELPPGSRKIVVVGGRSIGVFNVGGRFFAVRNSCPHQGAPLCAGAVTTTAEPSAPGEYRWGSEPVLVCPWHGWEFDIATGRSVFDPHDTRVRTYAVDVEPDGEAADARDGEVAVETFPLTLEDGLVVLHA